MSVFSSVQALMLCLKMKLQSSSDVPLHKATAGGSLEYILGPPPLWDGSRLPWTAGGLCRRCHAQRHSPAGMNGVEVGSVGGSPFPGRPPPRLSSLAVHPGALRTDSLLSAPLPSRLCLLLPLPSFFARAIACTIWSLISMALISMGSKCWNKHVRLDIGLCRKRRSVARLLPALWHDSRWAKWRAWALQRTLGEREESAGASDAKVLLFWRFPAFSTSSLFCPSKREFSKLCRVREITVSLVSTKAYTKAKAR